MNRKDPGFLQTLAILCIAVPMLGFMAGGIYSFPAIKLTKGKEPWLSMLLAAGLAVTVLGIGASGKLPWLTMGGIWLVGVALLVLARWFYGSLSHSLESFGVVHVFMLMIVMFVVVWHVGAEKQREKATPPHASHAKP